MAEILDVSGLTPSGEIWRPRNFTCLTLKRHLLLFNVTCLSLNLCNTCSKILKMSRLKKKAKRSKDRVDIANYKKQRNLVVSLNRQAKSKHFNEDSNTESSRPF